MKCLKSSTRKGFTLIEILIVLAIVGVLVAVLFPMLAIARRKGEQATCQNNLKQIALAIRQYVQDHDSRYPQEAQWKTAVVTYAKNFQVLQCPAERVPFNAGIYKPDPYPSNYFYSRYLDEERRGSVVIPNKGGASETVLNKEAQIVLNGDYDPGGQVVKERQSAVNTDLP